VTEGSDRYAERRELLEAGWEPRDAEGTVVWRSPVNDYFYPHDLALRLAREQSGGRATGGPSGGSS
jgi:hypothetical protein